MKISIITAVYNNVRTIDDCIQSVLDQTYSDIEYIIIDGGSRDGTIDAIKRHKRHIAKFISEPDKGMYDAMNKGIRMASGDVIGFLHGDDLYANNKVLETVASRMDSNNIDSCYGDLLYVRRDNIKKTVRYWKSCPHTGWSDPARLDTAAPDIFREKKSIRSPRRFRYQFHDLR